MRSLVMLKTVTLDVKRSCCVNIRFNADYECQKSDVPMPNCQDAIQLISLAMECDLQITAEAAAL